MKIKTSYALLGILPIFGENNVLELKEELTENLVIRFAINSDRQIKIFFRGYKVNISL